jgi:hypothetical protein
MSPIRLALFAATLFTTAAQAETPERMVVTSDPQYPWTDVTDNGGDTDPVLAEKLVREQYESIAAYRRAHPLQAIPVIINGDLTSNGIVFEHQVMHDLFGILGKNYYFGLGNHDYENNLTVHSACRLAYCATGSLDLLTQHVKSLGDRVLAFDLRTRAEGNRVINEGSWAYAFKADGWKNTVHLQLNNAHDYAVDMSTYGGLLQPKSYNVTPSTQWVLDQSRQAIESGRARFTFVHVHKPEGWDAPWRDAANSLAAKAAAVGVKAIFSGHYHKDMGVEYIRTGGASHVPHFTSGSASQRTYLIVEHWREAGKVKVYGVRNNDPSQMKLLDEIDV